MSSVRINASKGGGEAVPHPAAAPRAGDGTDPAAGFAAALGGATTAKFQPPTDPPSSPDDKPASRGHACDVSDAPGNSTGDATAGADAAATAATLPGLAAWAAAAGDPAANGIASSTGRPGPAKPDPTAAAAIAASQLAGIAVDVPKGTPLPEAGKPTAATPDGGAPGQVDLAAASADPTVGADPTAGGALGLGLPAPAAIAADPSTAAIAANLSAPVLTQAVNPVHIQFDPAALAVAAPAEAAAALVAPIAASAGGSGTHDFADTGRNAQAAAAAAFDGVASAGMGPPGGIGTPGIDASAAVAPAAPAADAGAANIAAQISGQVLRLLANSGHEAVVRLYPPDLGEVTVRVAVSGRDVTAWFGSSQPDVQQTISLGLGQLQADLGNAGYSLNGAWVGADTSGFGSRGGSVPRPPGAVAAASAVPVTQAAAAISSNTGVSIYV